MVGEVPIPADATLSKHFTNAQMKITLFYLFVTIRVSQTLGFFLANTALLRVFSTSNEFSEKQSQNFPEKIISMYMYMYKVNLGFKVNTKG